jgi:hypothetical protein
MGIPFKQDHGIIGFSVLQLTIHAGLTGYCSWLFERHMVLLWIFKKLTA